MITNPIISRFFIMVLIFALCMSLLAKQIFGTVSTEFNTILKSFSFVVFNLFGNFKKSNLEDKYENMNQIIRYMDIAVKLILYFGFLITNYFILGVFLQDDPTLKDED